MVTDKLVIVVLKPAGVTPRDEKNLQSAVSFTHSEIMHGPVL